MKKLRRNRDEYTVAQAVDIVRCKGGKITAVQALGLIDRGRTPPPVRVEYGKAARKYRVFVKLDVLRALLRFCRDKKKHHMMSWRSKMVKRLLNAGVSVGDIMARYDLTWGELNYARLWHA